MLSPGDTAPAFTVTATDGSDVTLSDYRGRRVILYFYPRDDTPGCTIEACSFRDNIDQLTTLGVDVFGVSDDDVPSHETFAEKYALNFQLLADTDHRVIESYGAWVEKRQYGRKFMGTKRVTYLIGADGNVEHVWPDVEPAGHVEEILSVLQS